MRLRLVSKILACVVVACVLAIGIMAIIFVSMSQTGWMGRSIVYILVVGIFAAAARFLIRELRPYARFP